MTPDQVAQVLGSFQPRTSVDLTPKDQELSSYSPTFHERVAQGLFGEHMPSPAHRRFGEGVANLLDFTPIGQAASAVEAAKRGDYQGAAIAALPGAPAARAAKPITGFAKSLGERIVAKELPNVEAPAAEAIAKAPLGGGPGPGVGGGATSLEEAQAAAKRAAGPRAPVEGLPQNPIKTQHGFYVPGPSDRAHAAAEAYAESSGIPYNPPKTYAKVDKERAAKIANEFDTMAHAPDDPRVKASYDALAKETLGQWQAMKDSGLKIDWIKPGQEDPYASSPRLAMKDISENNHWWGFPTDSGFGTGAEAEKAIKDNPMLAMTDEVIDGKPMRVNDIFRIVHDYFGHLKEGHGFRAEGEENAWRSHAGMYSDQALPAMTAETRGQNSWVNYGPHGETNRTASAADTTYAPQKIGMLPDWVMQEGRHDPLKARAPVTPEGLPIQGKEYSKASTNVLKEIAGEPKGTGPLDLTGAGGASSAPQAAMERYEPARGVSERLTDALKSKSVLNGVRDSIRKGMEMGAHKWYDTEPVRQAFIKELGEEEGPAAFQKYMDLVAATSPRSDVPTNIRNASFYYSLGDKPIPEKLPYPYGHVAQNLHRQNVEGLANAEPGQSGWNILKNPKPASFSANLTGNKTPVTVDTHAFRNIGMRTGDPRFLETSLSVPYKGSGKDPAMDSMLQRYGERVGGNVIFRPQKLFESGRLTMKDAQKIPTFWASKPNKNEYKAAEEIYTKIAKEFGLEPAEAQAAAWAGGGELTGLGTTPDKTFPELFNNRVEYTARMRGEVPKDTLAWMIRRKKPLLGLGGAAAVGAASQDNR